MSSVCAAVGGTTPGLWVTSASSCASDSAARAAASRPAGPSTNTLRKASAGASLANAPLSRARSIQRAVNCSTAASSSRSIAKMVISPSRRRATSGSTSSARKAWIVRRTAGTAVSYPPVTRGGAALQKQIGSRFGRIPGGWKVARRPCDLLQEGGAGGPPGEHGCLQCEEHGVPRGAGVERPQSSCRRGQGVGGLGHVPPVEPDPAPQLGGLRGRPRIAQASWWPRSAGPRPGRPTPRTRGPALLTGAVRPAAPRRGSAAPHVPGARPRRHSHRGPCPVRLPPPGRPRPVRRAQRRPPPDARPGELRRAAGRRPQRGPGGPLDTDPGPRSGRPPSGRAGGRTAPPARRSPFARPRQAPRQTP